MNRVIRVIAVSCLVASIAGCCVGPYRCWQNYIGWNNPEPDAFVPTPPPVTTPPGPLTPAVLTTPEEIETPDVD